MADNYRQWSEVIEDLTDEEIAWIRRDLARFAPDESGEVETDGGPVALLDDDGDWTVEGQQWRDEHQAYTDDDYCWPDFDWEINTPPTAGRYLWLYNTGGGGNLEHVADFIQRFIRKFRPEMVFKLTWAEWCSAPRVGEFGGGWLVVHKDGTKWGDTWSAARRAAKKYEEAPR